VAAVAECVLCGEHQPSANDRVCVCITGAVRLSEVPVVCALQHSRPPSSQDYF
jgi:hypothetical protein